MHGSPRAGDLVAGKKSFILYTDLPKATEALSDSAFRELIMAACHYTEHGVVPSISPEARVAFPFLKVILDRDHGKWETICERNRTNGGKGGRPPKKKNPDKPKKPSRPQWNPENPTMIMAMTLILVLRVVIGAGKSHVAAAIANQLLGKGIAVIFLTERHIFQRIRKTYSQNGGDEAEVMEIFESVPLLVIDDVGKEKPSAWSLSTLYAIIDGRYEKALPTIITTNFDTKDLKIRITPDGGDETAASAIIDRLTEMCIGVTMTGPSWRGR